MKVIFNPNAAAHNPNARPPQAQNTSTTTAPSGTSDDGVEITLSPAAKQALKAGAAEYTGNSPAQQARQALAADEFAFAEGSDPSKTPFGQIVKTFAHARHTTDSGDTVSEDGGDVAGVTEPTEGGDATTADATTADGTDGTGDTGTTDGGDTTVADGTGDTGDTGTTEGDDTTVVDGSDGTDGTDGTGATDGTGVVEGSDGTDGGESTVVAGDPDGTAGTGETDPTIVVEEPDITEVLGESAPVEGEVTEPESSIAGSGDAVASSGDDATVDEGTSVDSGEPLAVVDTGGLTDELLDLLDEGSEEVV